jgi:hypothetical protein
MASGDDPGDPLARPDGPDLVPLNRTVAAEDVFRYVLNRADVVRQRAQLAATVAGVAAVAILTSTLSNLGSYGHPVTYTLVAGAIMWTVSLVMWVAAIGGQITAIDPHLSAEDPGVDLTTAIRQAQSNAEGARGRLKYALWTTIAAVSLTAVGLGAAAIDAEQRDDRVAAELWLTPTGAQTVRRLCHTGHAYRLVRGAARIDVTGPSVSFHIGDRAMTLRAEDVLGIRRLEIEGDRRPACDLGRADR